MAEPYAPLDGTLPGYDGNADQVAGTGVRPEQPDAETELLDMLGYVYLQHGLPDKAAVILAARDVLVPDNPRALLSLALAQVRSGKPGRAIDTLDRLAMLGAMSAPFHLVRGQALQALGRTHEAAAAMRAFVSLKVSSAPTTSAGAPSTSGMLDRQTR